MLSDNIDNLSATNVLEATSKASLSYFPYHKNVFVATGNVLLSMRGT